MPPISPFNISFRSGAEFRYRNTSIFVWLWKLMMLCFVMNYFEHFFSIYMQKQLSRHTPLWNVYCCNHFVIILRCSCDVGEIRAHLVWSVISLLHAITNVNFSFMQTSLSNSVVIHISFRMEMSLIQIKHSLISNLVSGWVTINFPSHYLPPVVHNQRRIVSLVWFRKRPLLDRNAEPCHIIIKNSTPPTHTHAYTSPSLETFELATPPQVCVIPHLIPSLWL